jgi:hypothetical protein
VNDLRGFVDDPNPVQTEQSEAERKFDEDRRAGKYGERYKNDPPDTIYVMRYEDGQDVIVSRWGS